MNAFLKKYIIVIPALCLFAYTCIRAWHLSFTIDESFSFLFYVLDSYKNIFHFKLLDPNNHVLNTFLMKCFSTWFPLSELTLRLQSLIAHAFFMLFTWLLVKNFKNTWFSISAWLILNLNPFMLDFFSLARGYALGWAMMTGSLYFLKEILEKSEKKFRNILLCFLFGALSVLASFPLVNYYMALMLIFCLIAIYKIVFDWKSIKNTEWFWLSIIMISILSGFLLYYTVDISFKMQNAGYLYFGGIVGFWKDTVGSLVDSTLYGAPYGHIVIIPSLVIAIIVPVAGLAFIVFQLYKFRKKFNNYYFFIAIISLLFIIISGIICSHSFLNTRVVIERAAVFIEILFLVLMVFLIYHLFSMKFALPLVTLIAFFFVFHFFKNANNSYFFEWKSDASTREAMQDLEKIHAKNPGLNKMKMIFQPYWLFATTSMFYQYINHDEWMEPIESAKEFSFGEDYYYFPENDLKDLGNQLVEIVKRYPLSHTVLLKNTAPKRKNILGEKSLNFYQALLNEPTLIKVFQPANIENQNGIVINKDIFSPVIKLDTKEFSGKTNVIIKASFKGFFPTEKCGDFVISFMDKEGKLLKWNAIGLGSYLLQKDGWMTIPYKINIENWDPNAASVNIFIWNTGKNEIIASDLKAEIIEYK